MNEIKDIHEPFIAYLKKNAIPYHRNRPDRKTTGIVGDPDFLCVLAGRGIYVECKVPGKKLSTDQVERIAYLRAAGNRVEVAYSLQECVTAVRSHFGVEKAASEPPEHQKQASETDLSGGAENTGLAPSNPSTDAARTTVALTSKPGSEISDSPAQNLWIADLGNRACVFSGDPSPGGLAQIERWATPEDIRNLPRR